MFWFLVLGHQKLDLELNPDPELGKMLDPDPHLINADPQPSVQDIQLFLYLCVFCSFRPHIGRNCKTISIFESVGNTRAINSRTR